jgi:hypothetical protein
VVHPGSSLDELLNDVQLAKVSRQNERGISVPGANIWICPLFNKLERNFIVYFDDSQIKGSVTIRISGILDLKFLNCSGMFL